MFLNENLTWIVNTNSNICRIYSYSNKNEHIILLKQLEHPGSKLRDIELTSDKPGRYQSSHSAHGAFSQASDPKEIQINQFSKEIAQELAKGRNMQAYNNLIIISTPHMNGLINQHINKEVKNCITHTFNKDLIHLAERELLEFLKMNAKYSGE